VGRSCELVLLRAPIGGHSDCGCRAASGVESLHAIAGVGRNVLRTANCRLWAYTNLRTPRCAHLLALTIYLVSYCAPGSRYHEDGFVNAQIAHAC